MARLAFFGTPNFSLPALKAVFRFCQDFGHELSLVVSQEDKPQGRGKTLQAPPVKLTAAKLNLRVIQPSTLRRNSNDGDNFFEEFSGLLIDLAIVVAYGKIIPERLLKLPRCGFLNVHASLLPKFRGAAPIQRAIEAGDKITGVCLMDMERSLDEGDIYTCETTPILSSDNSDSLFWRLSHMGARMLYDNLGKILDDNLTKTPQDESQASYAHRIEKSEGAINFSLPAAVISRRVRALDSAPGSFAIMRGKRVKLFDSFFIEDANLHARVQPGTIVVAKNFLGVKALDGIVYFQSMQVEGKNKLSIREATLGFSLVEGDSFLGCGSSEKQE